MRRHPLLAAVLATVLVAGAGCVTTRTETDEDRKTLRVWLMEDSVADDVIDDLNDEFEDDHPGYKVRFEVQKWAGIQATLSTALSSNNPPDIIETGSTQTVAFARGGALADLTDKVNDLRGEHWLPGLAASGEWNKKQYGIPFFASNRIVVYRKDMFERAGVKPPTTQREWLDVAKKLQASYGKDPQFQAVVLPGTLWYVLSGLVQDRGGAFAVPDGDRWKGAVDTPQAIEAMRYFKELFDFGKMAPDSNEDVPRTSDVFAQGKSAMMVSLPLYYHESILKNPTLDGKLGVFLIPGITAEKTGSVFLGGSNLSIPVRSKNQELAYEYLRTITSDKYETKLVQTPNNWYVPSKSTLAAAVANDPVMTVAMRATVNGHTLPVDPRWAAVEDDPNVIRSYMTAVLAGGDIETLAREASNEITRRMNVTGGTGG